MAEDTNQETNETGEQSSEHQEQPTGIIGGVVETVSATVSNIVGGVANVIENNMGTVTSNATSDNLRVDKISRRAQKVGTVSSDKMTKTVIVNVDRQVMHPKYRRYVRRRTKFMAHDEMGATIGDKVRIEETRPLSARKRWRVIEIVQKAAR